MIIRLPNGTEKTASLYEAKGGVIVKYDEDGTGAKTMEELQVFIANKADTDLNECEIIEASEKERTLLKKTRLRPKGL